MQDQGHLWLHAFRYQSLVEIAEGTLARGGLDRRAFKYIFEMVIVTVVQPPHRYRLLGPLELPVYIPVIGARVRHHPKAAVFPKRPLGTEAVRCLENRHQHGRADRTQGRNRAEQFPGFVFLALSEEFLSRLLAQENQCVQLLVVKLRPAAHAGLRDLAQPLVTMARVVDTLATTGNAPAAIDGFHPVHDPREILADGQISPGQFFPHAQPLFSVIDRAEQIGAQQLGQLPRIDPVALAAFLEQGRVARIAHHDLCDVGLEQVIQPCRPGAFLKGDVQSADELE